MSHPRQTELRVVIALVVLGLLSSPLATLANKAATECICPLLDDPVCNPETGKQYSNKCFATCAGDDGVVDSGCPIDPLTCICPAIYEPVCSASTGKTYGNLCEADCASALSDLLI
jgi:hypothetical protein